MAQGIVYQIDATKALATVEAFNKAVVASGQVLGEFATKTVSVNSAGTTMRGTIEQLDGAGKKLTSTFIIVGGAADNLGTKITQAGQQGAAAGQAFTISWQNLVRILEVQLFRRAVTSLVNATRDGIQSALAYQVQLQQVANVTGQQGAGFDSFQQRVRALSDQFGTPLPDTLAASQVAFTSQLNNASAGFDVLTNSMRLSQATGTDLASSTRLVTTALQAFNLSSSESGRVANLFFLAAQRTTVPLDEMHAAVGRVSQVAAGLNLDIEKLTALFLTISQQGGRPTEAFSLLNQVLGRLQRPTKELQEWLNSIGTPTANIAIQTFGFAGFLDKLNIAATETPERLGTLSGSIRTLRGLMAVTGDNVGRFEENLRSLNTSTTSLFDAQQNVQQNPAQRLITEFQKFKNFFEEDVGRTIIETTVRIADSFGGAEASAAGLISTIKQGVIAFGFYKLTTEVLPSIINNWAAASNAAASGTNSLAASVTSFGTAATIAYTAGATFFELVTQWERARAGRVAAAVRDSTALGEQGVQRQRAETRADMQEADALVQRAFATRLRESAQRIATSNEVREVEINNQKAIREEFRISSQTFLDTLRTRVSETRKARDQAESDIIASRRSQEAFGQQIEQRGFQRRLGVEQDPEAAIRLIENRTRRLQQQVQNVFSDPDATREQIAAARAVFQEIDQLNSDRTGRETEIQRLQAEQNGNWREVVRYGQTFRVIQIDLTESERRSNALLQQRNELEETYRTNLEATRAAEETRLINQQTSFRIFESLLRQQEQFKVANEAGELLPRFAREERNRPGGGATAALAEFDTLAERLREHARQQRADLGPINTLIDQRRESLTRELGIINQINTRQADHRNILADQTTQQQALRSLLHGQAAAQQEIIRLSNAIALTTAQFSGANIRERFTAADIGDQTTVTQRVAFAFNEYKDAVLAVTNAQRSLNASQTTENVNAYDAAVQQLTTRMTALQTRLRGAAGGVPVTLGLQAFDRPGEFAATLDRFQSDLPEVRARITAIRAELENLRIAGGNIQNFEAPLRRLIQAEDPTLRLQQNFNNASTSAFNAGITMTSVLDTTADRADRLNQSLSNVIGNFGALATVQGGGGGEAGFLAGGGIAGLFPGAPKGTDVLPYWLTKGEYIMDAVNSRRFRSQLVAMSHGVAPQYAASGGVVVGDVNISNVTIDPTGDTPARAAIKLGRELQRQIRRGTVAPLS